MKVKLQCSPKAKPSTKNTSHSQCSVWLGTREKEQIFCYNRILIILSVYGTQVASGHFRSPNYHRFVSSKCCPNISPEVELRLNSQLTEKKNMALFNQDSSFVSRGCWWQHTVGHRPTSHWLLGRRLMRGSCVQRQKVVMVAEPKEIVSKLKGFDLTT